MRQLSRRSILTGLVAGALGCGGQPEAVRRPSTDAGATDSGEAGAINTCRRGEYLCNGQVARRCDGKGGFSESVGCDQQCMYPFGCVVCTPGEGSCANGIGHLCLADGSRVDTFDCDPVQGMRCEPDGCRGSCAPAELSGTYLGCEYFPTVMLNPVWHGFDFAVAVANAEGSAANLLVTRGSTTVSSSSLEPGGVAVLKLPWVDELKGGEVDACQNPPDPGATRVVPAGAYRLRTDQPVTVYQLSPLEYRIDPPPADCPVGATCPYGPVAHPVLCLQRRRCSALARHRAHRQLHGHQLARHPPARGRDHRHGHAGRDPGGRAGGRQLRRGRRHIGQRRRHGHAESRRRARAGHRRNRGIRARSARTRAARACAPPNRCRCSAVTPAATCPSLRPTHATTWSRSCCLRRFWGATTW